MTIRRPFPLLLACASLVAASVSVSTQSPGDFAALVALHEEFSKLRRPAITAGVPDYTSAAMGARQQQLGQYRSRLDAINPSAWPVPDQIDYLLVRAQMNALDFDHRVTRPWERDPNLYVDLVRRTPYTDTPASAERLAALKEGLLATPKILDQARGNLVSMPGELARMAIRQLEKSDGVNQGEPRRPVPPEGVIGWYDDLLARLPKAHPDLVADAKAAQAAVIAYRDWLSSRAPSLSAPAGLGLEPYNWYLKNVRLLPYDVDDVRLIGQRELVRARSLLKIEQNRNRAVPPIVPVKTAAEHERRTREAERWIRTFITREKLLTIPAGTPETFETDSFWIVRAGGKRHFWEELTYRDPLNNHIHASIPGHQFDGMIQRKNPRPIRRSFQDGARGEGWGFYIEEMFLQAGLLDDRPRSRELFYIAQLKRAARIEAELKMQTGEFTLQQAIDYLIAQVPLMDEDLARYDLNIYLRRPAYGMNYTVGKAQMEQLLSDRAFQLKDGFELGKFHDEFLSKGSIPMALIRWEMTGLDDQVKEFFKKP